VGRSRCPLAQADRSKPVPALTEDSKDAQAEPGIYFPKYNPTGRVSGGGLIRAKLLQLSCSSSEKG